MRCNLNDLVGRVASVCLCALIVLLMSCDVSMGPFFGEPCPDKITLDPKDLTIYEGRPATIRVRGNSADCHVSWSNSDYTVLSINGSNGGATIKGKKEGVAIITAAPGWNEPDANSPACKVTVLPVSVDSIDLSPDTLKVVVNSNAIARLEVRIFDSVGVTISRWPLTWTSSDSTVAKVYWSTGPSYTPQAGHVRGYKLGEVTITASYGDFSGTARVRVLPEHLYGVWGSTVDDVFTVGIGGAIYHYDGTNWDKVASGTKQTLRDIWGDSLGEYFAVGDGNTILYYDGGIWSVMDSGGLRSYNGVWGNSSSDVFVVGGSIFSSGTIIRYDGNSWTNMEQGQTGELHDIWGGSETEVFTVGNGGIIRHYDGQSWTAMESGTLFTLKGVWGHAASDVLAIGRGIIIHYDGDTWHQAELAGWSDLNGVWGSSANRVFAVGKDGVIQHFDGSQWSSMASGTTETLWDIWGGSGGDAFAVGDFGTILHFDGISWTALEIQ